MNKFRLALVFVVVSTLFYIGALIYYEMAVELENHPEIENIGGPPVFTDLRLVLITTIVAVVLCGILLKYSKEDDTGEETNNRRQ